LLNEINPWQKNSLPLPNLIKFFYKSVLRLRSLQRDLALVKIELDALKADQQLQPYRDRVKSHYDFCKKFGFLHDDGTPDDFKVGLLFERINQAASQLALEINREYPSNRKVKRRRKANRSNKS
jgi:hypothetical protein